MSNTVTHMAKRRVVGSSARKAVLMYMADNASDDGSGIWTSKRTMAADLEMSRRTVQSHIQAMVDSGLIFEVGERKCSNGYTVEYGINMSALSALPSTRAGDAPVQHMHPHRCSTCTPTGAAHAPKPPLEPPIEQPIHDNAGASEQLFNVPDDAPPAKARLPEGWVPDQECLDYAHSLNLTDDEIEEIANDFHTYWRDRTDKGGRKSERGWKQAWRNRVRDQAPRFIRNRKMAGRAVSGGYGQGGSIASVVARRHMGN